MDARQRLSQLREYANNKTLLRLTMHEHQRLLVILTPRSSDKKNLSETEWANYQALWNNVNRTVSRILPSSSLENINLLRRYQQKPQGLIHLWSLLSACITLVIVHFILTKFQASHLVIIYPVAFVIVYHLRWTEQTSIYADAAQKLGGHINYFGLSWPEPRKSPKVVP